MHTHITRHYISLHYISCHFISLHQNTSPIFPQEEGTQNSSFNWSFFMLDTGPAPERHQVAVDVPPFHVQNGLLPDAGPTWPCPTPKSSAISRCNNPKGSMETLTFQEITSNSNETMLKLSFGACYVFHWRIDFQTPTIPSCFANIFARVRPVALPVQST